MNPTHCDQGLRSDKTVWRRPAWRLWGGPERYPGSNPLSHSAWSRSWRLWNWKKLQIIEFECIQLPSLEPGGVLVVSVCLLLQQPEFESCWLLKCSVRKDENKKNCPSLSTFPRLHKLHHFEGRGQLVDTRETLYFRDLFASLEFLDLERQRDTEREWERKRYRESDRKKT